ncbi:heat shock 70 kDa protein 12A-like [Mytilus californianus]|uniref:heat shock 70 kDa protein 12A-like n=1 Tax=Mytilus californianus TaxID=6549 RepID=UPI002247A404|nr:heat shock 70 kDa protein 12A-like [Mytilus californianus]
MAEKDWIVVTAIDLRTTFSGYAFSFRSEFKDNPLKISTNSWISEGVFNDEMKAPSVLLLNPDQSFNSFGYRAQNNYKQLLLIDPEKAVKYYFVQDFKMQLHNREISLGMKIQDITGKTLLAKKVFVESIKYLKDHFLEIFTNKNLDTKIKDILFVITVPAIWTDAAKQFMRVCSEMAGIESSMMILAYEPEAAALYCSLLPADQGIAKYFEVGRRLMIVDLGGGTVDITVIKVIKKEEQLTYIEHVYRVTGGAWGGNQVNKNFENFLAQVFGNDVMEEFKMNHLSQWMELKGDFELQKKTLSAAGTREVIGIRIGVEIVEIYKRRREKDIANELRKRLDGKVKIIGDKLCIDVEIFKKFFHDCVTEIINHINETFMKRGCAWPSAMILVGGFADALIIRDAIINAFPVIKPIVSPPGTSMSVLKGSVIFGHRPGIVTGRVCRETLGLTLHRPYVPEGETNTHTFKIDGILRVDKSFNKLFTVNEVVKLGQTRTLELQDLHKSKNIRKQPKIIEVYVSKDEDPNFITDSGCSLRGKITVYPPNGQWPETTEGFIDLETGGTEITVRYRDKHSGQITEENIDFL